MRQAPERKQLSPSRGPSGAPINSAHDVGCRDPSRPGRGLRCAVRPADRPPGARGARLQRDRALDDARRGDARAQDPAAVILSGGPSSVYAEGAPQVDAALFEAGVPALRHLLRLPGDGAGARRRRSRRPACREFGRTPLRVRDPTSVVLARAARASCRSGCRHGDAVSAAPEGFVVTAHVRRRCRRRRSRTRPRAGRRAVPPRGPAHRARPAGARAVPLRRRRDRADLDDGVHRRRAGRVDPRAGRRQASHLRALRRRRLRGRGGARAARGGRPADLRVRRPRAAAAGRGRAGRARLRRRDRRLASRSSTPPTRSSPRSRASPTPRRSAR